MKTEEIIAREKRRKSNGTFFLQCDHLKGEEAFISFDLASRTIAICRNCADEWYLELLGRVAD